jgi:UDP-N-acetylmuramyl pentapeptide phosphotransferase/UDP-N-acetylglucosamine-1-phosphate transferase
VHALPFLASLAASLALAPRLLRTLARAGSNAPNYRGRSLPCPFGLLVPAAALTTFAVLALVAAVRPGARVELFPPQLAPIALYAGGVICLGLVDDKLGGGARGGVRGLRGHARSALRGEISTGALKAAGFAVLALFTLAWLGLAGPRLWLAAAVLALSTNAFNLLDLRPGRAAKSLVLLGAALSAVSLELHPLWALGPFLAPALVAGGYDLRERAMLGDTGSNLLGALGGVWLVLTVGPAGQLVALVLLAVLTIYGDLRSISDLIERTPWLRGLDSVGRP